VDVDVVDKAEEGRAARGCWDRSRLSNLDLQP
jgi:hypothetical protein